jgi:hypothetical protein
MKQSTNQQPNRSPVIIQNFHTADLDDLFQNVFRTTVASQGLHYVRQRDWQSDKAYAAAMAAEYLLPQDKVLTDMRDECDLRLAVKRRDTIIQLFACAKFHRVTVFVAGHDAQSVEAIIREHDAAFEAGSRTPEPNQPSAKFGFWYLAEKGPEREEKELNVPTWDEIKDNYSPRTWEAVGGLLSGFKPAVGGRLLLWHGKPGTGKTFALRALAWQWREWCQFEYIFDPENLFGPRADYLARIVIDGNESAGEGRTPRW